MDISNASAWNAGTHLSTGRDGVPYHELNKIEIKSCLDCGYTKKMPYKVMICPNCDMPSMGFFIHERAFIRHIDLYGLMKLKIDDEELKQLIRNAYS